MPKNPVLVSSVDRISLFLPRRGVHVAALMHAGGFEFVSKYETSADDAIDEEEHDEVIVQEDLGTLTQT